MSNNYHYFASHALGFAMADTREDVIEKLIKGHPNGLKSWLLNAHKDGDPGVYIWTCRVNAPLEKGYKIEWFQPVGVEVEDGREHYLTYVTAKKFAIYNKPKAESLAGLKEKAA
jgi:hypothetical protein